MVISYYKNKKADIKRKILQRLTNEACGGSSTRDININKKVERNQIKDLSPVKQSSHALNPLII